MAVTRTPAEAPTDEHRRDYTVELFDEDNEVIIAGEAVVLIDDLPTTARQ